MFAHHDSAVVLLHFVFSRARLFTTPLPFSWRRRALLPEEYDSKDGNARVLAGISVIHVHMYIQVHVCVDSRGTDYEARTKCSRGAIETDARRVARSPSTTQALGRETLMLVFLVDRARSTAEREGAPETAADIGQIHFQILRYTRPS